MWSTVVIKVGEFMFNVNREKPSFVAREPVEDGSWPRRRSPFPFVRMELETRGLYSLQRLFDSSRFCCERERFTLTAKR